MDMFNSTTLASSPPSPRLPPFSSASTRDRGLFITSSSPSSFSPRGVSEAKAEDNQTRSNTHQTSSERVRLLTAKASSVAALSQGLTQFLANHSRYRLFSDTLHREIQKILSRSQVLSDGEVSIYDIVLLNLTQNGMDLELDENPAAVMWFVEEFLGIDGGDKEAAMFLGKRERQQRMLEERVTLPKVFSQGAARA